VESYPRREYGGCQQTPQTVVNNEHEICDFTSFPRRDHVFHKGSNLNSTISCATLIGHRGVRSRGLENSLPALRSAVENPGLGLAGVEIDIHSTADGELVLHHDPVTARGTVIATAILDQLQEERLPDGSPFPTLTEALAALAPLTVYVEAKGLAPSADAALLGVLENGPTPGNYQVHSFDHRIIRRLTAKAPWIKAGVLSASYPVEPERQVLDAGAGVLWQHWELVDAELVDRCRAHGIEVIAWTVPEVRVAEIAAMGVAGICRDI
jgi:glycerophosphoryl diester phosphodiesterase